MSSTLAYGGRDDHYYHHNRSNCCNYFRLRHHDFHITFSRQTNRDSLFLAAKNTECKKSQVYFCICGGRREFGLYVRINVPV